MKGVIVNYRRGRRTQHNNQIIIKPADATTVSEASKLLGKKVIWKGKNKQLVGKITRVHGCKGNVVATFVSPPPGQAIGTEVEIVV